MSKFEGKIELSDILSFVEFIQKSMSPKRNLYDVRNAELNIKIDDLPRIISERNKFPTHPDNKSVFLLATPNETVLGTFLIRYAEDKYNVAICSTLPKAISIMKLSYTSEILEEMLITLTNKF